MALDLGILLAITAMISWGIADFFAKKAIDKIGYKTSISSQSNCSLSSSCHFCNPVLQNAFFINLT